MNDLVEATATFKSFYGSFDLAVSGVALEHTEKHKQISVSLIPRDEDIELDLKALKSYYQRISIVTNYRLSAVSRISFLIDGKINYRVQLKFLLI